MKAHQTKEDAFKFIKDAKIDASPSAVVFIYSQESQYFGMNIYDGEEWIRPEIEKKDVGIIGLVSEINNISDMPNETTTGEPIEWITNKILYGIERQINSAKSISKLDRVCKSILDCNLSELDEKRKECEYYLPAMTQEYYRESYQNSIEAIKLFKAKMEQLNG